MLLPNNQRVTSSPVNLRDRPIPALPTQQNVPHLGLSHVFENDQHRQTTDELIEDQGRVLASTRAATERRLRLQSEQLKRFHQQICLRVNEHVWQQREDQQSRDKRIDAKVARLLQLPSTATTSTDTTQSMTASRSLHLSRGPYVETLLRAKQDQLKEFTTTQSVVGKILQRDAQAREMLLVSTRMPRVRESRICETALLNEDDDNQTTDGHGKRDNISLPEKQRKELYAAVRRRYMTHAREQVQQRARGGGVPHGKETTRTAKATTRKDKPKRDERSLESKVKVVDVSKGCELKLQRQSARTSSTPWRNSPPAPLSSTSERFLIALQEELGTPALCSCGGKKGHAQCANNCEFYRHPKRKERAAASVCKQHNTTV